MTIPTNPLLARFAGEPALIEPAQVERFRACLEAVAASEHSAVMLSEQAYSNDEFWQFDPNSFLAVLRPYVVKDGILHIPVKGVLLHNFPYAFGSWATGYIYIQKAFERGMADDSVKAVALIIDSPGGMVAGCGDAADKMVAAKSKPVRAFAHESAYSAAYWMACVADHIAVSRTGGVGSVGVVTMHVDYSKALAEAGITITYIHAGKHKVDGNAYEPLPDDVKARFQARIDELYGVFVSAVARGRGMEEQAVRDTEALTYSATQAVSIGFADSIGSLDDAVAAFAVFLDDQSDNQGEEAMADEANTSATVDQAAVETARTEGQSTGRAEGVTAERERIAAILGSDEAKDRPALAHHLAMNTATSPEDAKATLAVAAKETAEAPAQTAEELAAAAAAAEANGGTGFTDAMSHDNPDIGGGNGGGAKAKEDGSDILALAASVGVKGFAQAK